MSRSQRGVRRLWAPWRSRFLYQRGVKVCIFCRAIRSRADRRHYVFQRSAHAVALLNLYPYNNGHAMVAPRRHVADLRPCSGQEVLDLWRLVDHVTALLRRVLKPHGFNIGINLGRDGGAGIPRHLHVHIVPRWRGDTNFMPVLADTKIISESLDELYDQLTARGEK